MLVGFPPIAMRVLFQTGLAKAPRGFLHWRRAVSNASQADDWDHIGCAIEI